MSIEIEKKYRLTKAQREEILERLKEIDAEYIGEDLEENILYRGGILDEKRAVLRIRKIGEKAILTFKQRIQNDSDVKHQTEHETSVSDPDEIENIVENLGFKKKLIYEKRRKTWRFRQVEIVVDQLPFGLFMEIEGSITAIAEAEMFLDIDDLAVEHKTYPSLTAELGSPNGDVIEARFT